MYTYIVKSTFPIDHDASNKRANFTDIGRWKGRKISVVHMSFSLGSKYKCVYVTYEKDIVVLNRMTDTIYLPYSFSLLDVRASKSSSELFWVVFSVLVLQAAEISK